ncbi:NRAMP family divalent metal transporter [Bdellovibrio sp. ZAP7]|uniref:NRAMP family divalent metal transporter n=1 Tax=Bdellovibrio sp. ZAP7 TaxID=2231053 RepID=UPI00143D6234|nr:divalent metal cation transporter [Bdellovibrio sp. ZAP7]
MHNEKKSKFLRTIKNFGPGMVTGAADDDPSGVATYTIAGALYGYKFLWTSWLTWPLMACVQMMCADIALASEKSLTEAIIQKYSRSLAAPVIFALFTANILNVAADLSAMADALAILTGHPSLLYLVLTGIIVTASIILFTYRTIARTLTWLTFFLLAYVFTAMKVETNWEQLIKGSFYFRPPESSAEWSMIVALLGTTISPYLFFWQSSQELEELRTNKNFDYANVKRLRKWDILLGTFISNLIMYFIIWTAAGSLHASGIFNIENSAQAARALEPLLGHASLVVYTIGILGVGMLAIPTLVGSSSLAVADLFRWQSGLNKKWNEAQAFYSTLCLGMCIAIILNLFQFNPIKALFYSAVVNGLLSPVLIVLCLLVSRDSNIMKNRPLGKPTALLASLTALVMLCSAVGMFLF